MHRGSHESDARLSHGMEWYHEIIALTVKSIQRHAHNYRKLHGEYELNRL